MTTGESKFLYFRQGSKGAPQEYFLTSKLVHIVMLFLFERK